MRKKLHLFIGTLFVIALSLTQKTHAQAPQGIPYQAVARDNAGNLIKNQNISLRFSIHDGTASGAVVYSETHSVTTDALGLFAVNIGGGTSSGTLADVNWGSGAKFTQVELDVTGGDNYTDMGTTQMMSVPYALYAANANVPGVPGPQGVTGATGATGPSGATGSVGSVTAISGTSNANGATISEGNLTLTPASATNGGIVTAGTQTFGGVKTFSSGIVGDLTGNATSATKTAVRSVTGQTLLYPSFVNSASTSSNNDLYVDNGLSFNSVTNTLTASNFLGNLTGNVTGNVSGNASSASTASTASTATITTSTSENLQYIPFVAGASGDRGLSSNNQLRFYPNTGELLATSFRGNVIGNATSATTLAGGAAGAIPYQSSAGTTSYTASGTVGQVLTSNGTFSAPSWKTPSSGTLTTNGYPFMPIQNATSTLTSGTKSYWYIVRLTSDTTINGIQLYLSSGSDTFRCGIYRGYVKTGVSGSITLIGQTTDTAMTIGLPYMSKPITAIAGQSLTFAAGEYMTIAFHSSGSTAVYYQSTALAVGNSDLMYSSTANYVSGFPTTLTQTSISAAIVNKVCFELY